MVRWPWRPALAAVVVLLACARHPPPPAQPLPLIDACDLLTFGEANGLDPAAGLQPMTSEVDAMAGTDGVKCIYASLDLPPVAVNLEVRPFPTLDKARRAQDAAAAMLPKLAKGDFAPVPGIGDGAFWAGGELDQLHVLDGRLRLIVSVGIGAEETRRAAAETIARRAVERLAAQGAR